MDTRLLDVAIGLALVFVVSSLLVTALQELLTSLLKRRGKTLEASVMSLLQDDQVLTSQLFDHPLVKALYRGDRLPSYLPTNVFVTSLLNVLGGKLAVPREGTPAEFVARITQGQSETGGAKVLEVLPVLLQGAERDWPTFEAQIGRWYDEVGERATGWFKRDTQRWLFGLGFVVAAVLNIDALAITSSLWKEKAIRQSMVQVAQGVVQLQGGDVAGAPAGEAPKPQAAAKPAGRADEKTGAVQNVLAGFQTVLDAPDSDDEAYYRALEELGELKASLAAERAHLGVETIESQTQAASVDQHLIRICSIFGGGRGPGACDASGQPGGVPEDVARMAGLLKQALAAERQSRALGSFVEHQCDQEAPELRLACVQLAALDSITGLDLPMGWSCKHPLASRMEWFCGPSDNTGRKGPTVWAVLLGCIAGWLIIGIASTLGAPFWFDLLNRLMKLRASGARLSGGDEPVATAPAAPAMTGTNIPAAEKPASSDAMSDAEKRLTDFEILSIQRKLGMSNQEQTGRLDLATRRAIGQWQKAAGRLESGVLTDQDATTLLGSGMVEEEFEG